MLTNCLLYLSYREAESTPRLTGEQNQALRPRKLDFDATIETVRPVGATSLLDETFFAAMLGSPSVVNETFHTAMSGPSSTPDQTTDDSNTSNTPPSDPEVSSQLEWGQVELGPSHTWTPVTSPSPRSSSRGHRRSPSTVSDPDGSARLSTINEGDETDRSSNFNVPDELLEYIEKINATALKVLSKAQEFSEEEMQIISNALAEKLSVQPSTPGRIVTPGFNDREIRIISDALANRLGVMSSLLSRTPQTPSAGNLTGNTSSNSGSVDLITGSLIDLSDSSGIEPNKRLTTHGFEALNSSSGVSSDNNTSGSMTPQFKIEESIFPGTGEAIRGPPGHTPAPWLVQRRLPPPATLTRSTSVPAGDLSWRQPNPEPPTRQPSSRFGRGWRWQGGRVNQDPSVHYIGKGSNRMRVRFTDQVREGEKGARPKERSPQK